MANSTIKIPRAHLIMALCLPLAVLLGYFLAEPMDSGSMAVIVMVMFVLGVPLMMKWHHLILVLCCNGCITPVIFPGQAPLWLPVAGASLVFALLNRAVNPEARFIYVPSLVNPLLFLAAVVLLTAWATGGIGLRSLGSARYGGRNYAFFLAAVTGFFALSSMRIPPEKAGLYIGMYFLTGLTAIIPNIIYMLGPAFYPLFSVFPVGGVMEQARGDFALDPGIVRITGLSLAGPAVCWYVLARYGIRGTLDFTKPLRLLLFAAATICCAASGFRSCLILFVMTLCTLFYFEGLHKTRFLPICLGLVFISAAVLLPNANKLPLTVQRTISFLPAKINAIARNDAEYSTEWRLQIWKQVLPDIPKYLLIGKGYSMDPNELYQGNLSARELNNSYEVVSLNGDYHNGPLSVIIPFGIFGTIGFLWFLIAAGRFLYHNYRFGDAQLQGINTFLLAFFVVKVIFFFAVFGSLYSDLFTFTGLLGLSVSLNGRPEPATEPELAESETSALEAFS